MYKRVPIYKAFTHKVVYIFRAHILLLLRSCVLDFKMYTSKIGKKIVKKKKKMLCGFPTHIGMPEKKASKNYHIDRRKYLIHIIIV